MKYPDIRTRAEALSEECDALRTENARLREALEAIHAMIVPTAVPIPFGVVITIESIARHALNNTDGED